MMQQLEGKTIIVSGAASGMGAACAELAAHRGATVVGMDRDGEGLARLGHRFELIQLVHDLTDVEASAAAVARCAQELGGLDGLVNAAGVFRTVEFLGITVEDFDRMFAINLRAHFFLMQAAAKAMVDQGGSIVNFASTAARVPRPISSHYAAGKAAVVSFTRSAAAALGSRGVRVNAVCPGVIATPMIESILEDRARRGGTTAKAIEGEWCEQHPMGRLGTPMEVAEVVAFLLSDAASYVTGESLGVNGGSDDI
jgi:NAD(P)-dependent dehydrogenase (short-subunit alcohol dehydrogenase family)